AAVRSHFRPEFLNRVDEIILFHRLKRSDMAAIVDIQIDYLRRLLSDREINLELDNTARAWLAEKGYDPAYGARPLRRVIQKYVQDPLAEQILAGKLKAGDTASVTLGPDGLLIGDVSVVPTERPSKRRAGMRLN
ncbi:MAG: ATP-dependent chaperone ClpB, partial [Hyphomicrobiales bacterium]|nr:ATP-dependent chaperone ClpB [Hyphomicrobiales bacterium]